MDEPLISLMRLDLVRLQGEVKEKELQIERVTKEIEELEEKYKNALGENKVRLQGAINRHNKILQELEKAYNALKQELEKAYNALEKDQSKEVVVETNQAAQNRRTLDVLQSSADIFQELVRKTQINNKIQTAYDQIQTAYDQIRTAYEASYIKENNDIEDQKKAFIKNYLGVKPRIWKLKSLNKALKLLKTLILKERLMINFKV